VYTDRKHTRRFSLSLTTLTITLDTVTLTAIPGHLFVHVYSISYSTFSTKYMLPN